MMWQQGSGGGNGEEGKPQSPEHPAPSPHEPADVALVDPQVLEGILGTVDGESFGQTDAVDAARRRAGDDVDHDTRPRPQRLGVGAGDEDVPVHVLGGRRRERIGGVGGRLELLGGAYQPVDLLGDPVHVDGEGDPSVTHQGET
jgi:hypothetical protein